MFQSCMRIISTIESMHSFEIYAYLLFCFVLTASSTFLKNPEVQKIVNVIFALVSCFVIFGAAIPVVADNKIYTPDEPELISNALRLAHDPLPWRSADAGSSGPLNAMVLMWPLAVGKQVTLSTARLTGIFLMAGAWVFLFLSLKLSTPAVRLAVCSLVMTFLAGTRHYDYTHYATEHLSIFLLVVASCIASRMGVEVKRFRVLLFIEGLVIGCVPFAKLQAAPLAALLGAIQVAVIVLTGSTFNGRKRSIAVFVVGSLVPAVSILGPLAFAGGLKDFWISYIEWALGYLRPPTTFSTVLANVADDGYFLAYILSISFLSVAGMTFGPHKAGNISRIACTLAVVALSAYVGLRGLGAPHYLLFLIFPLAYLAGVAWPHDILGKSMGFVRATVGLAMAIMVTVLTVGGYHWHNIFPRLTTQGVEGIFTAGNLLSWIPSGNETLFIWGWNPEWYVYSQFRPATREGATSNSFAPGPLQSYFRNRLLSDFETSRPPVVIDAAAPGSFYFTDARSGLKSFPELQSKIALDYELTSSPTNVENCPRTYLRSDVLARMKTRFATIKNIRASSYYDVDGLSYPPALVNDSNIYESCIDRWLLPNGSVGDLTMELEADQAVTAVWLLNTRNGAGERNGPLERGQISASRLAQLQLLHEGKVVFDATTEVRRYPYWTVIPISAAGQRADAVRIFISEFIGVGGGLNEVKVEIAPHQK
jgi:hypothetical protein